jgi:glucose/arabinose dehydrogenase
VQRRLRLTLVSTALTALAACGGAGAGHAQTGPVTAGTARTGYGLTRIGSFDSPVYVAQAPGDAHRLFVVEQAGTIRVIRDGRTLPTPFLDIHARVKSGDEQGLLSMAFAPDYQRSGRFYVFYTDLQGTERVVEYRRGASADRASPGSARSVLALRDPEPNHNGGLLLFGPDDLLYVGIGDGGGEGDQHGPIGNGQSLKTLFGKILRIDPRAAHGHRYTVPRSNPFVGRRGARPEIYSWGLRNPWRFSFDRANGDIAIGDVGQDTVEEVDFRRRGGARGANFGWRAFEATHRYDPSLHVAHAIKPVLEYLHDGDTCSVTGGYVIRDPRLPSLDGRYIYGDYCAGELRSARLRQSGATARRDLHLHVPSLTSFGQDNAGRIYAASGDGPVYRLDPR